MTTLPDTENTRAQMIETCLWMNARGINQGTSGNISVRVGDGILITPSGIPYEEMTPDAIMTIPADAPPGDDLRLKPSSEWRFHQRLQQARPDMPVVIHAHPPHCTILSIQRRPIPACHYMIAAFGGADVPLTPYALYGSEELANHLADAMKTRHACLMSNHGATVLGETMARARWRLEELETLARSYLLSHIGGTPHILSDAEIAEVSVAFESYGPK